MAKAAQKIALSPSRDIPLDRLELSPSNVRKIFSSSAIAELADDIASRGLLHSLGVRPVLDEDGSETGRFEIPYGGRRIRALQLLAKQKRLAKDAPIPCIIRPADSAILAEDDSLAENARREALHPLDQFRAMQAMVEKGYDVETIASHHFATPAVVRQRLKLAGVSPKLHEAYAQDQLSLEQLMAFTISDDFERQEFVFKLLQSSFSTAPTFIRQKLTENSVRVVDKRVRFVGLDAYVAAGGSVARDLFEADGGGWLTDPLLLDKLVAEKLETETGQIREEGWKWVDAAVEVPWNASRGMRAIYGEEIAMTDEEQKTLADLEAEGEALSDEWSDADEVPDEVHILDNMLKGRRRAVWLSVSDRLLEDAQRDWTALGQERLLVTPLSRYRQGTPIKLPEGVLFTTYATLRSQARDTKAIRVRDAEPDTTKSSSATANASAFPGLAYQSLNASRSASVGVPRSSAAHSAASRSLALTTARLAPCESRSGL